MSLYNSKNMIETRFVTAATFRALAHLCNNEEKKASDSFYAAGLLNHAAAIEINMVLDTEGKQTIDLIELIATLIKKEYATFKDTLYQTPSTIGMERNKELSKHNSRYMYGIGPDEERWKNDKKLSLNLSMRRKFRVQKDQFELRKDEVKFYKHATDIEHFEYVRIMLEEVVKEIVDQSKYKDSWDEKCSQNHAKFKSFFNHDGGRITKYVWKWSDEKSEHQHKPGFAPSEHWYVNTRLLDRIHEFISPYLTSAASDSATFLLKDTMTMSEKLDHIVEFTGVTGSTLAWICPDKINLPVLEIQTQLDILKGELATWIEQFEQTDLFKHNERLQFFMGDIVKVAIKSDNYESSINGLDAFKKDFEGASEEHKQLTEILEKIKTEIKKKESEGEPGE